MKLRITQKLIIKRKLLVDNTQEIIIFFDSDGKINDCNSKAILELGYGEDIYQIPIYEIFRKTFKYEDNKLEISARFHNKVDETIAYRKNQTCFPVELKVSIVNEKRIYMGLCTAFNISDKKETFREVKHMKSELKTFEQVSNEFVANITHELRTPVSGIMGLSDNLLETELKPKQTEIINLIKRCCSNMNLMINDLLDFAKISNDKMIIEQREFSFQHVIQHIIDFNKIRISEKGLKLLVNISNDIPDRLIGDELRLTQVLNNLFSNAVKFTTVGQIALEVNKISQTEQSIELFFMIIDTGIGISVDEKDKLFHSFSQVDGSITRRFGGTGLGLSISKKLVEAMNGTIAVDSEKSKGSAFSFSIRLGIPPSPNDKSNSFLVDGLHQIYFAENGRSYSKSGEDSESTMDFNYIETMLQELDIKKVENPNGTNSMEEAIKTIAVSLEKLIICIEMESWDRAEEIAYLIKLLTPADHGNITKSVFRLLLAVRKENHDASMELINELMAVMNERQCDG